MLPRLADDGGAIMMRVLYPVLMILLTTAGMLAVGCDGRAEGPQPGSGVAAEQAVPKSESPAPLHGGWVIDGEAPAPIAPSTLELQAAGALTPAVLERVAVIGASATCGFGVEMPVNGPYGPTTAPADIGHAVEAVLKIEQPVSRQCSMFFFTDPMTVGPMLLTDTLAAQPTIVFALDYLFWYGYGHRDVRGERIDDGSERLELLEAGLTQVERLSCPVVVGDFPDMRAAIGLMLGAAQVPEPATLIRLNERLRQWAATRPNIIIVPLSDYVRSMTNGADWRVGEAMWSGAELGETVIQPDRLHPTADGLVMMAQQAAQAVVDADLGVTEDMFELDHEKAMARLREVVEK